MGTNIFMSHFVFYGYTIMLNIPGKRATLFEEIIEGLRLLSFFFKFTFDIGNEIYLNDKLLM